MVQLVVGTCSKWYSYVSEVPQNMHDMWCCLWLCCNWCVGKKGKGGGKKGSKLVLTPEAEQLLTHVCCCLALLVAGGNADCYRVAAAGCLKALVQLGSESRNAQLRRAAKV